jgi:hypothetical protein
VLKADEGAIDQALRGKKLSVLDFKRILDTEITPMLNAVARDETSNFIRGTLSALEQKGQKKEELAPVEDEIKQKVQLVEGKLFDQRLRSRMLFKETAKQSVLHSVSWEIRQRTHDSAKGEIHLPPHVAVEIISYKREHESPVSPHPTLGELLRMIGVARAPDTFILECDEDELDELILILQEAKKNLRGSSAR